MIAITNGQPLGIAGSAEAEAEEAARAWLPNAKHAATRTTNEAVLSAEVSSCVPLPQRIPRHCSRKNPQMILTAISGSCPARTGKKSRVYSAITMETAAAVPHVESQSLQPTMKRHALGSIFAMSPGVRTIPAAMALPTATAMPNHTPSTWRSLPEPRVCGPADALVLVEDSADVLDNVESQVCIGNSAIIMAMRQNASWKWTI